MVETQLKFNAKGDASLTPKLTPELTHAQRNCRYVGICAGAYLGCEDWLELLPQVYVHDIDHWARGKTRVSKFHGVSLNFSDSIQMRQEF